MKKKSMKNNRRRGQSSTEYLLIGALVVGLITIFGKTIKERIGKLTGSIFDNAEKSVGTLTSPN